jgi:hypothetical protein
MNEEDDIVRKRLSDKLGVDFCTEEELQKEFEVAQTEVRQVAPEPPIISVGEIIMRCNDAIGKMSVTNPHRYLLHLCASALNQLVNRIEKLENPEKVM